MPCLDGFDEDGEFKVNGGSTDESVITSSKYVIRFEEPGIGERLADQLGFLNTTFPCFVQGDVPLLLAS